MGVDNDDDDDDDSSLYTSFYCMKYHYLFNLSMMIDAVT